MRVLIIGKKSFIAQNFIKKYSNHIKLFYFDLYFSNNYKQFLKKIYQYVNNKKINHIINFVGNNDNSLFPNGEKSILRDNFILPLNLVDLFNQKKINFTFFTSAEIDKIENPNENNIYSLSKFFLQDSLRFVLIWSFRSEVIKQEKEYIINGGKLIFHLPMFHIVDKDIYKAYLKTDFKSFAYQL